MMRRIMPATAMLILLAGCDGRNGDAQPEPGEDAAGDVAVSGERAPSTTTSEPTARAPTGDATPTAVESASTSASPPHSTTPPTTPSPAPSSEPTLYTLPNVPADDVARNRAALTAIPASYLGEWDGVEGSCAPDSDLRMMVRPGSIGFYESRGEVTAVRRTRDGLVVSLAMEGEGERWEEDYSMRLVAGRERLAVTASSYPDRITMRKRCPADRGSSAP